jgi:hypothetical protein
MKPLHCRHCAGRMKITTFVVQAEEIKKILAPLKLQTEATKIHSARGPPQIDSWEKRDC